MVFAGGETDSYRDSGLAQPNEGERARVSDREGKRGRWWGGKVDCASVHPSSSFPEPRENEQNIKNTKEQVKPLFPLVVCFRLPQLSIKTIHPFVCSRSLA